MLLIPMTELRMPLPDKSSPKPRLFCFVHIQKCGGTTLNNMLRRNFGLRHVDIIPVDRMASLAATPDFAHALRFYPRAFSFAGHSLRPYCDFGRFRNQMAFYTLLRDPVQRFISDYHEHRRHYKMDVPFEVWAAETTNSDWQVKSLSKSGSLEEAKEVLASQFAFFDVVDNYSRFVATLAEAMSPHRLVEWFEKKNVGSEKSNDDAALTQVVAQDPNTFDIAMACNQKDLELLRWAREFLGQRYAHSAVAHPLASPSASELLAQRAKNIMSLSIRNLLYKPSVGLWPGEVDILPTYRMYVEK